MAISIIAKEIIMRTSFKQRIVICGSMSFYADMITIKEELFSMGIYAILPESEEDFFVNLSQNEYSEFKRSISFRYLKKIRSPETIAVLAVNKDKHGIFDYIGPNTFAEIAVAFAQSKKIFLFQGIPSEYKDELSAWNASPLGGSLLELYKYYKRATEPKERQMSLFEAL